MIKPLKITLIVIAILLTLFIGISFFVKSYLTDERVRTLISGVAEKSLGRKVLLGEIKISLFRGIVVSDFEIKEKDSEAPFFRAKDFILRYQLLPLLSKRLVIDELSIIGPEIHLKKNPDGSFNFSDLGKSSATAGEKKTDDTPSALPLTPNIKTIAVKNAKIDYTDPSGKLRTAGALINAELGITGLSAKVFSSEGSLDVTLTEVLLKDRKQPLIDLKTDIRFKVGLDMDAKRVILHSIDVDVMNIPLNVQGTAEYTPEPSLALDVKVPDLDLLKVRDMLSKLLPQGMILDGSISLLLNLIKKPVEKSPISFDGELKMTRVSLTHRGMHPVLDGTVKLTPDSISFDGLRLLAGSSSAGISGSVRNYQKYPDVTMKINSKSLDLDELFLPLPAGGNSQQSVRTGSDQKEPEGMNLKIRVNASLDIDRTSYRGIAITNFRSRYELKDNIFRILNLSGNTLRGGFAFKATVDLSKKGTQYDMNSELNGIKLEEAVNAFAPKAKDKIFGGLSGKAEISGSGTLPDNVKRNLKGKGTFTIRDGVIKNAEVSTGLLAILGLQELHEIPIQKAEGNFTLSDGLMNLASVISSKDIIIDEKGLIGLDEKIDLGILVKVSERLTPRLLSQSALSGFLTEEKGWTNIPLRLGGTITKPSYSIDTRAIGRKTKETIQKKIGEELFKSLSKDKEKTSGTEKEKAASPEELIKGLFGK